MLHASNHRTALQSLQGALGKTSGRSYKAAPRQLLQVDNSGTSPTISPAHGHISKDPGPRSKGAEEAAKLGRETLGNAADVRFLSDHYPMLANGRWQTTNLIRREPLSHREILTILEYIYDLILHVEQLRRDQPSGEDEQVMVVWQEQYDDLVDQIWDALRVMVPLETRYYHFILAWRETLTYLTVILIPSSLYLSLARVKRSCQESRAT